MLIRHTIIVVFITFGICSQLVNADGPQDVFPISVRVIANASFLRAGPSDDFYPTERLVRDDAVEVWAIDPAGYCAVRPVNGSFSWLRAADIDDECLLEQKTKRSLHIQNTQGSEYSGEGFIGVVVTDGAVSRVGSQLNDLRHVAQVRLEAGERVRVRETIRVPDGRHAGLWVRIEPPSGEYRWIHGNDISLPEEFRPASLKNTISDVDAAAVSVEAADALREAGDAIAEVLATVGEMSEEPVDNQETVVDPEPPKTLGPVPMAKRLLSGWLPLGSSVLDPTAPAMPVAVSGGAVATSDDELADIDLALSLAVTGPSESWTLQSLRERLRVAAQRATTQDERLRAEAIDARLSRFESVQNRQRALIAGAGEDPSPLRLGDMWSSLSEIGSRPIRPGVFPGGVPADGQPTWTPPEQMETTGRLATVVSRRPDAPRWAIVDGNNNVVAFVTPSPGVNLAPLVGQQISVRGAKGYMPEYKLPYMVATEARPRMATAPPTSTDTTR